MKPLEQRKFEAGVRQASRNERTPQAQLAALDAKFGKGQGATKERKRLQNIIDGKVIKVQVSVDATQAIKQIQQVTKAVQKFGRELKKVPRLPTLAQVESEEKAFRSGPV